MSKNNEQKQSQKQGRDTFYVDLDAKPQHSAPKQTHANHTLIPTTSRHYKLHLGPITEEKSDSFFKEGKVFAHTINAPFTTIPFIPAATPFLRKFDKATGQDLGFTFKASLTSQENKQGDKDLIYKIDYVGFGIMSSKFNVQLAPLAAKIEAGKESYKGFGCNLSTLTSPIGFVHERLGAKATVTDCNNNSKSISLAEEISYQKSSSFKPISTATYGYFFGNDATLHIPAGYVPTLKRIKEASPSLNEWETIGNHIGLSVPAIPVANLINSSLQTAEAIANLAGSAITSKIKGFTDAHRQDIPAFERLKIPALPNNTKTDQTNDIYANGKQNPEVKAKITENLEKHQAHLNRINNIKPSIEEKANYVVQTDDTLEQIGKKTGHPWEQIFTLNKNTLGHNPDKIYPGQELLIPENHADLMNNPVVQARIREIMAKQQVNEYTR
jgi:LysM repeat protein